MISFNIATETPAVVIDHRAAIAQATAKIADDTLRLQVGTFIDAHLEDLLHICAGKSPKVITAREAEFCARDEFKTVDVKIIYKSIDTLSSIR